MVQPNAATIYLGSEKRSDISTCHIGESTITTQVTRREDLSSSLTNSSTPPSSLSSINIIINAADIPTLFDPLSLAGLIPSLRSESTIKVTITPPPPTATPPDLTVINTAFLLAGLHPESERKEDDSTRILVARRRGLVSSYSSSAKISLVVPNTSSSSKKVADLGGDGGSKITIKLDDYDDDDDDDDLIDEDGLLEIGGDEFKIPTSTTTSVDRSSNGDDCGGRKACDNCTCGRAEKEAGVESVPRHQAPTSSACGKCGMGDAFRCASCPYLGKPAFKPGEEHLVLDLDDDIHF